jgi:hypothetical protein
MAENITLSTPANLQNETSAIGVWTANNSAITSAFVDCLSRSGTQPNTMGAPLDMNNNPILNLPPPASLTSPLRLTDLTTINPNITVPPTGTSGAVVPFLNGNNTWSGNQIFTAGMTSQTSFAAGTFGIGFASMSVGTATANASINLQNTAGTGQFSIGGDNFSANRITLACGANLMYFIGNNYMFADRTGLTPSAPGGFLSLNMDSSVTGSAIWFRTLGVSYGDIYNTTSGLFLNCPTAANIQFQVNNQSIAGVNSSGIFIGQNGVIGGLLALEGATSGVAQLTVTATGGTMNINSTGCSADTSGNFVASSVGIGNNIFYTNAPVTYTGTTGTITSMTSILNPSGAFTATLPSASTFIGRWLYIKNIAVQTVTSASSNVVPLAGGAASTALLSNVAGKWAILQSDGTNWNIMAAN